MKQQKSTTHTQRKVASSKVNKRTRKDVLKHEHRRKKPWKETHGKKIINNKWAGNAAQRNA